MTYLYQHIRKDNGEVFYVGIGDKYRPYDKHNRNKHWVNIINRCDYEVEIVRSFDTWEEACEWEKLFILIYGKRHTGEGTLVNITDGGEGSLGRVGDLPPFYGKKRPEHSAMLKGRKCPSISKRMSGENHFFYGSKLRDSHKSNISKSKKGKYLKEENHFFGKSHTNATKKKISAANSKSIVDANTGEVVFNSLKEASRELGIKETTLSAQLRGRNKNTTPYLYYSVFITKSNTVRDEHH